MADRKSAVNKSKAERKAQPGKAAPVAAAPAVEAPAWPIKAEKAKPAPAVKPPLAAKPAPTANSAPVAKAAEPAPVPKPAPAAKPQPEVAVKKIAEAAEAPATAAAKVAEAVQQPVAEAAAEVANSVETQSETIVNSIETGASTMTETINNTVEKTQAATQQVAQQATEQFRGALNDANERGKVAIEKGARLVEEMADLTRGNLEAFVASQKTAAKYVESLTQGAADYSRRSFEEASTAFRSFAEAKSPTDIFRLQSDYARSAFDAMVSESARVSETVVKMTGEVAEPLTSRYSVAAERLKTVAA